MENEMLGELQQKTGKIMEIKEVEKRVEITFATSTGDIFFGGVVKGFEGVEGLQVNDIAYLEFFEYPDRAKVEFELINRMDRAAVAGTPRPRNADEKAFHIRREQAIQRDLGYRALFVDNSRDGLPIQAFFLMEDSSLVVINYKPSEPSDEPEKFTSAKEYLKHNQWKLDKAGEFDAIKQLADYLDTSS